MGMVLAVVAIVLWIAWLARAVLPPFLLAAFLAFLLTPVVDRLARLIGRGNPYSAGPRGAAVLIVYSIAALALSGLGFLFVPWGVQNVRELIEGREEIADSVREQIDEWLAIYEDRVDEDLRQRVDGWVADASDNLGQRVAAAVGRSVSLLVASASAAVGFLLTPIWLFLILKDQQRFSTWFFALFPPSIQRDVRILLGDAARVLSAYLRVLGVLSIVIGMVTYVGLMLLSVPFAPALAIVAAFAEFIPVIGPIIAAVVAALVVLAVDPGFKVLWVLLFFLAVQQLENYVLVPRLQGRAMDVHPAIVMMLIIVMGELAGIIGMVVAIPLYAVLRNSFVYVHYRLGGSLPPHRH